MLHNKRIGCVIPARLKSSRFPKKILAEVHGRPLIEWVWRAAKRVPFFDELLIAIDSEETAQAVEKFGGAYVMTSESCLSGTDRLCQIYHEGKMKVDIWVNWQGDEPLITQRMIEDLLQSCDHTDVDVWTVKKKMESGDDPHSVKVVTDRRDCALYFSRSPIPYYRDYKIAAEYFQHVGLYAYRAEALGKISRMEPCAIEVAEQLEQLRFLYNGLKIKVHETTGDTVGVDLPEHLTGVAKALLFTA